MTLSDAIKQRIIELCKERNITISKMCTLSGLNHSSIASFLSGKTGIPKIDTLYYLTLGLNISLCEFYNSPLFDNIDDD